jgi:hypothetical protein
LKKLVLLVASLVLSNCVFDQGAKNEALERYSTIYGNGMPRSEFVLKNGRIEDTTTLYDDSGSIIQRGKYGWSNGELEYESIYKLAEDTLALNKKRDSSGIKNVVDKNFHLIQSIYSSYNKTKRVSGYGRFQIRVVANGTATHVICLENTTGQKEFILKIVNEIEMWKFNREDSVRTMYFRQKINF